MNFADGLLAFAVKADTIGDKQTAELVKADRTWRLLGDQALIGVGPGRLERIDVQRIGELRS